jgi:hypothetical protein
VISFFCQFTTSKLIALGHVNIKMVMWIYGKWLPDNSIATRERLEKHIELAKSNGPAEL